MTMRRFGPPTPTDGLKGILTTILRLTKLGDKFCRDNIDRGKMTAQQAHNLVHEITESKDPRIRGFLDRETGLSKILYGRPGTLIRNLGRR